MGGPPPMGGVPSAGGPPKRPRRHWRWVVPAFAVVLAAVIVAAIALSGSDDQSGAKTRTAAVDDEQKRPEPLPDDSDRRAALTTLDDIDPCDLLDVRDLKQPDGVEKVAVSSHQCAFEGGGESLTVTLGTDLGHLRRIESAEEPVAGVKAYSMQGDIEGPGSCTWSIPVTFTDVIEFRYETGADEGGTSCSSIKRYAERGVETVQSSGHGSLFFQPGEPDVAARGDCRYFFQPGGVEDCHPYSGADPRLKGDELLAAAEKDRNVQCAVFKDAIEGNFGSQLSPVVWGEHCFFVSPDNTYLFRVNADPAFAPDEYGAIGENRREVSLGGFPAITFDGAPNVHDVYLSPYGDLSRAGMLHISARPLAGRGTYRDDYRELSDAEIDKVYALMAQSAKAHFG